MNAERDTPSSSKRISPNQQYNSDCGANTDGTDIGKVSYQRYGTFTR
jgi:hypothetical protein